MYCKIFPNTLSKFIPKNDNTSNTVNIRIIMFLLLLLKILDDSGSTGVKGKGDAWVGILSERNIFPFSLEEEDCI